MNQRNARDPLSQRILEVASACLLGMATIASAWCAYQSAQWNERSANERRLSSAAMVEGTRLHSLASTTVAFDANVITAFANAVATDKTELAELYRKVLVRPEFVPILDQWQSDIEQGRHPENLLENDEYLDSLFGPYREADQRSTRHENRAVDAGRNAVSYLVTTMLLAVALFFAGISNVFNGSLVRLTAVSAAGVIVAVAAARIAELPVP